MAPPVYHRQISRLTSDPENQALALFFPPKYWCSRSRSRALQKLESRFTVFKRKIVVYFGLKIKFKISGYFTEFIHKAQLQKNIIVTGIGTEKSLKVLGNALVASAENSTGAQEYRQLSYIFTLYFIMLLIYSSLTNFPKCIKVAPWTIVFIVSM